MSVWQMDIDWKIQGILEWQSLSHSKLHVNQTEPGVTQAPAIMPASVSINYT